ncbi:helix-hairpin-helix domain-containing protein [Marinomonas sp. IMCC 4694]|nr:helix-hairpin-helix domain-containing protein [Marinomonas sp. IMCC 4694]
MMNLHRVFHVCVLRTLVLISLAFTPFSIFSATPLDINTATASELSAVMSGVGVKKAQAIIDFRETNGPFKTIAQLSQVKGIGDALILRNKGVLRVLTPDTISTDATISDANSVQPMN